MMAEDLQSACTSLQMGMVRSQCGSVLIRTYKRNGYKRTYDRIRTFEPRSEEGNENEAGTYHLQSSAPHEQKDMCTSTCDLTCKRSNTRWILIEIRTFTPPATSPKPYHCAIVAF
ncbi:hypothetical protein AVEN_114064-1 [Araneus ventricosus]|uniref:Uncharacterized protein n=1 Tax=Araneus ventricosus TaxID=182803 RepID=A0A4Y2MUR1_ARAVE|nr:hypothetical protein AVEN_114064-1 [Araneus ventricosus]